MRNTGSKKGVFFLLKLLCKASPIWVACSPEEDCSHWVWDTEVFLDAGDIWFSLLMLLLVSSFKIFLWQNYWYLSLVSEVSICKCSDSKEVLSLSGISINAQELILLRMKMLWSHIAFAYIFAYPSGIVLYLINRNTTLSSRVYSVQLCGCQWG